MRFCVLAILFFAFLSSINAQPINKKFVDERVVLMDTAHNPKQSKVYVINGIPYDPSEGEKIDSALASYDPKYLIQIDFLTCLQMKIYECINDVIVIVFASKQSNRTKRQLLIKIRRRFVDKYVSFSQHIFDDSKDPVLYIDNQLIQHTETSKKVHSLRVRNIYYIDNNDGPLSVELYGQNARNGLVRIWTISKK